MPPSGILTIEPKDLRRGYQLLSRLQDLDRSMRSLNSLSDSARLGETVENDVLARLANLMTARPVFRKVGDRARLRLCGEVMQDTMKLVEQDPDEILDLQSMSKASGLSPRTLQRTFKLEYGLCPQEWMRVERLHRVRDDLLNQAKSDSVTHTATRWGFFHLGRFSQYYRELSARRRARPLLAARFTRNPD